jgi:superfamily II DNA or RNA helicase
MDYESFLKSKLFVSEPTGFDAGELPENLYPYQKYLVRWACKRGKAALFTMTGTGKTAMQVSWANEVCQYVAMAKVLILAPLAVSKQTVREALKFGIHVNPCRHQDDVKVGVNIANYEMLHHFDASKFNGIVLDESSIIKAYDGKMRKAIIDFAKHIPYRLACTATPSPNDYMELGNHSEFLGVMSYTEMLSTFFVHDGGETSKWRLKGHAEESFWKWLASWGVFLTKPSDLGYSDEGFDLPPLYTHQHVVESEAP